MDRRSFLKSSLVLPSAALLPPCHVANQNTLPSLDRCFMDWEQHIDEVGEFQALTNLRCDMFPITAQRVLFTGCDRGVAEALAEIFRHYGVCPDASLERHSIKAHCTLASLPSERRKIRDWWLVVGFDCRHSELQSLRVVFINSCGGEQTASMSQWLAARITYRLHCRWNRLAKVVSEKSSLIQEVNRQVRGSMRGLAQVVA